MPRLMECRENDTEVHETGERRVSGHFYGRIRDVLHQCEYDPALQKVLEAETLKYGLTNSKIIEKVYALPKDADASRVLDIARAEEQAQTHIREVEKIRRDYNFWEKLKVQRSSANRRSPSAKTPRLPVMGALRSSTTARDVGTNMVPNSVLPTGKNAASASGRATFLSSAVAKEMLIPLASDLPSRNKYPDPRTGFTKRLQTQRVA